MCECSKEEGDFVQIHAGLRTASQESPTQTGLPSHSNSALLCLKPKNAKNSSCDLRRVNNIKKKKKFLQLFVLSSSVKGSKIVSQPFIVWGITASQIELNWLYPNLLTCIIYILKVTPNKGYGGQTAVEGIFPTAISCAGHSSLTLF